MKKIAIIGSGISSLVLGNLFKKKGLHFKIFEKKKELSINEGYGIQLSTNSIRILNTVGFMDFDNDKLFNPEKIIIKSLENQKEISNLNIDHFNISNEKYSCLKRSNLVKFLYTQVKKYVHFDHQILRLNNISEKQVEIEFNNNSEIFDYIIIASGLSFEFGKGIKKEKRGQGYGDELVKESLKTIKNYYGNKKVKISAQAHLKTFYSKHAFIAKGKEYLEDGIPHVSMECF